MDTLLGKDYSVEYHNKYSKKQFHCSVNLCADSTCRFRKSFHLTQYGRWTIISNPMELPNFR